MTEFQANPSKKKNKEHSLLTRPAAGLIHFVLKYHLLVLLLLVGFAAWAGLYSQENLRFKNRRIDLINPNSEWNQYWLEYVEKFGSEDDLIIVVDGDSPEKIIAAVNQTASEIEKKPELYHSLFYQFDDSALLSKALYFASDEELQDLNLFLMSHREVFEGKWDSLNVDRIFPKTFMPLAMEPDQIPPRMEANLRQALERMVFSLENALGEEYRFVSPFPAIDFSRGENQDRLPSLSGSSKSSMDRTADVVRTADAVRTVPAHTVSAHSQSLTAVQPIPPVPFLDDSELDDAIAESRYPVPDLASPASPSAPASVSAEFYPLGNYAAFYPPALDQSGMQDSANPYFAQVSRNVPPSGSLDGASAFSPELSAGVPPLQTVSVQPQYGSAVSSDSFGKVSGEMTVGSVVQSAETGNELAVSPNLLLEMKPGSHIHYTWLTPNKTAVMMVKMVEEENEDFARGTVGIETLRGILRDVQANHPGTTLKLTGLPVMENDEMRSSQGSMSLATWLSILGVALLYIYFFRELRRPLLALLALFVGMGWSMAYICLFVGHLNILSISFAVILIGLGIDFGIHYTSRYLQCRSEGDDTKNALVRTGREIGPGILTGALTTSAAFFMAGMTEFTGIAELGIIAGGGVLCCCAAALTVLPIFLFLMDRNRAQGKIPKPRTLGNFQLHPGVTFALSVLVVGALAGGLPRLYYDYNLLNLQPEGLESVELEMRLIEESKQSVWFALSMSDDPEVLRKRIEEFEKLESVDHVEQIVTLISDENPLVRQIHDVLLQTPTNVERPYLTKEDARKLYRCLETARQCLMGKEEFAQYYQRIEVLQAQLCEMKLTDYFRRMTQYQESLAHDLLAKFNALEKMSSPEPPSLADLPKSYVDRMYAEDGTYLLKIYGKGDLWDMANLEKFVKDVRSVDPKVTGNPLQTYECSLQMKKGYQDAAVYALAVVFLLLMLDLRKLSDTILVMCPVFIGLMCTFGIMGYLDVPLNAANMIVLPLLLGIGIDDGVHIIHDFRKSQHGGLFRIAPSTSMSIILTSLTTILSFGTLMLAQHRGLQSLGMVLAIGTASCWLSSLLILPAILNLFCRRPVSSEEEMRHPMTDERTVCTACSLEDGTHGLVRSLERSSVSDPEYSPVRIPESGRLKDRAANMEILNENVQLHSEEEVSAAWGCHFDDGERFQNRRVTCYTWDVNGEIVNSAGKAA